jgi:hypothetical protein
MTVGGGREPRLSSTEPDQAAARSRAWDRSHCGRSALERKRDRLVVSRSESAKMTLRAARIRLRHFGLSP